jgi:soluble lytic murein transglycosylase-like protein
MISPILMCASLLISSAPTHNHSKFEIAKDISKKYRIPRGDAWIIVDSVLRYSKRYDVPAELVFSVITVESAFNKRATSYAGAIGLMQVMPRTARQIAKELKCGKYNIRNIDTNIRFGTWYLKKMKEEFGDYDLAVRAYNCGPWRTNKVLNGDGDYPKETRDYYEKVSKLVLTMQMALPYIGK